MTEHIIQIRPDYYERMEEYEGYIFADTVTMVERYKTLNCNYREHPYCVRIYLSCEPRVVDEHYESESEAQARMNRIRTIMASQYTDDELSLPWYSKLLQKLKALFRKRIEG